ncbi:WD40-repeat-containing domain protein [Boletus coccyginus]|nr:WD40-repeat-containing domain protein [Boletus coccyginus]
MPQMSLKFTLTRHTKAVNAVVVSPKGSFLLSGGNDSRVVLWSLSSGEMTQEICVPSAGFISCLAWLKLTDRDEDAFVFGASDGNIHLYQRSEDSPLFTFSSICFAHCGAIESLAWDSQHHRLASVGDGEARVWKVAPDHNSFIPLPARSEKQPYVARSVHFLDDGSNILICYLESGFVCCHSIEPWDLKWQKKVNGRIGDACLDGHNLLVSNLRNGVDKYTVPTLHRSQSYPHNVLVNVPLQISVARQTGMVLVGGDNGFARIFDYHTGAFLDKLDHGSVGDLVVAVTTFESAQGCLMVTGSALDDHSNIKVWTEASKTTKPSVLAEARTSDSSIKQFVWLALVCVLVNLLMTKIPSDLLDISISSSFPSLRSASLDLPLNPPVMERSIFPPERGVTPAPLTQHKVFPREDVERLAEPQNPDPVPLSSGKVLILKPRGEVSRINRGGYNLQDKLGWPSAEYEEIRSFVVHLAREHLVIRKPWSKQQREQLEVVFAKGKERYPQLSQYDGDWVVADFLRMYLKNSSGRG